MRIKLFLIIFCLGIINMTQAQGNEFSIRASINVDYMFCDVKVNDVPSFDNRKHVFFDKGVIATNTNVQILAKNGINSISLEVAPLSWFESIESENKKNHLKRVLLVISKFIK